MATTALLLGGSAFAGEPWLQVGDMALRSDVEILAARGLIVGSTTTWPLPAGEILAKLSDPAALDNQPDYVRAAAERVLDALSRHGQPDGFQGLAEARLTSQPDVVRGFGAQARDQSDVDAGVNWAGDGLNAQVKVGEQSRVDGREGRFALDGSFVSAKLDNWLFYGGLVDQWYGPGWTSSLILSSNARPFPKVGLMRNDPHAFETPWLSWFGPWQVNLFGGVLDDPRAAENTGYVALRVSVMPISGLELALSRNMMVCGSGHACDPLTSFFHFDNSDANPNNNADSSTIELKYTGAVGPVLVSPYMQFYNRDTGPFTHSYTSHLVGTSVAGGLGDGRSRWRLTAEYTDSVPTLDFLSGPNVYGAAYNSYRYPEDGFRFHGRALGFSLDSDSKLLSLIGSVTDAQGWTYQLTYYHADINSTQLAEGIGPYDAQAARNPVSLRPVSINEIVAGLTVPFRKVDLSLTLRGQDQQPYPQAGATGSAEVGVSYRF
ncbi:MAG TPA: capsule assembly Wzi family protein [Aliidongia sp.]|uniref:capsule assembly Wzi family protein n=1 Tax=Aliidongia sp. TaxID=1914230 RepID=UPI002DDCF703|nr:capsule assembly Wzi family protein [Aliidongia sp.]HEV2675313.1 capsule assembly Wzi family protein [Aliidongia sp.]